VLLLVVSGPDHAAGAEPDRTRAPGPDLPLAGRSLGGPGPNTHARPGWARQHQDRSPAPTPPAAAPLLVARLPTR
jgi:hypothetical protein